MGEATRLRAQKTYSTDPDYLERMALAAEARELPGPGSGQPGAAANTKAVEPAIAL